LFVEDIEAEIGPRPPGLTLERVDNNDGYGPGKVSWATRWEQAHNRRIRVNGPSTKIPPRRPLDEKWLPVPGYAGFYEVSDLGSIYSLPRAATAGGLLDPQVNSKGYRVVILSRYGCQQMVPVGRLVLSAFRGPALGRRARHGSKGKADDSLANLEWR
jgi:hypothetical protein